MIGAGVHLYVYDPQKSWNDTLAVDSPFQKITEDFSSNTHSRNISLLSKSKIYLFNAHLALFFRRMTQLWSHNPIGKFCHLVN